MLTDLLVDIAELFESLASKVQVTAGQPPAASGEDCPPTFYVWGGAIYHSAIPNQRSGTEPGCFYRRTYDISWRLDVCYPVRADGKDLTTAEWLAVSETLYGLTDQAWCALTAAASDGSLFDLGSCEDITIGEAVFSDPHGGLVSAQGSVQVTHPCPPTGS